MTPPCINGERHNLSIKGNNGHCLKCQWELTPQQIEYWKSAHRLNQTIVLMPHKIGEVWLYRDGGRMVRRGYSESQKRAAILAHRNGDRCAYCQITLTDDTRTLDHYIPVSLGGQNALGNLRLCCRECNVKKKDIPGPLWERMLEQQVCDGCIKRWTLGLQWTVELLSSSSMCCADKLVNVYTND